MNGSMKKSNSLNCKPEWFSTLVLNEALPSIVSFLSLQETASPRWVCHGTARWRRRYLSMPSLTGAPHLELGRGLWCHHRTLLVVAKPPTNPWSYGALWTAGRVQCWSPHRIWSLLWSTAWWPALCLAPSSPRPWPWSHSAFSATPQ